MSVSPPVGWSVMVQVDPGWYALKGALADRPCPVEPECTEYETLVPLEQHTCLIGRVSGAGDAQLEVPIDGDTGVSRRHAQFVRDGDQLTIVDLSSTNGTYVVEAGDQPTESSPSLTPGVPTLLRDGDRVYIGAWNRLTVHS